MINSSMGYNWIPTAAGSVYAPGLKARLNIQNARIGGGAVSGALTEDELQPLAADRAQFMSDLNADKASGGYVNLQERAKLHAELNQMSAAIFELKHN